MRNHGVLSRVSGLGVSDHVCWDYATDDGYLEAGLGWVDEGLDLGQRVMYVADRSVAQMIDDLEPLGPKATRARDKGALVVGHVSDVVPGGGPVDAANQVAIYDGVVKRAVEEGYKGVRVLAEVTSLIREPTWRDNHVRWEQMADRYMTDNPLAALCAYDKRAVGEDTTALLACVHPLRRGRSSGATFSLFSTAGGLRLDGDVDLFQAPLLDLTLAERPDPSAFRLHISSDVFLDVAAISVIVKHAREAALNGGDVHLTVNSPTVRRVWNLLGFSVDVPV